MPKENIFSQLLKTLSSVIHRNNQERERKDYEKELLKIAGASSLRCLNKEETRNNEQN